MQRRRNAFQSGRAMEYWKVLSNTMVDRQGKFFNSRRSRMAKTVTCWPWWQPSNCFYIETLSFFSLFSHFSYCYAKKVEGPWPISPFFPPSGCRRPSYGLEILHQCGKSVEIKTLNFLRKYCINVGKIFKSTFPGICSFLLVFYCEGLTTTSMLLVKLHTTCNFSTKNM